MKKIKLFIAACAAMIGLGVHAQTDAEYNAALASIGSGLKYRVYTLSDGTTTGSTKYYLKTDGYLTNDVASAGEFTFNPAQGTSGRARLVGHHLHFNGTWGFTNGGAQNNTFSGDNLKRIGPGNQNRANWESQVFFLNDEGNYAVRSTNNVSDSWGANAFWTVVSDNDADGLPNATYTMDAVPYVWKIELVDRTDYTSYITNSMPIESKTPSGWTLEGISALNAIDAGNINAEFWNQKSAKLKQTITLPKGYYTLRAVAWCRSGQVSKLYAGTFETNIAANAPASAGSRTNAAENFNGGGSINELLFAVGEDNTDIEIGIATGNSGDAWTVFRNFNLYFSSDLPSYYTDALATAKASANAALDNSDYDAVTGYERTQLSASVAKTVDVAGKNPYEVITAYNSLIEEINTNLAAFTEAPKYYTQLTGENTRAAVFGIAAQTTTSQSAKGAANTQAQAVYDYVITNYNTIIDLGEWETTGDVGTMTSQHWDGTNSSSYNEQSSAAYGADSWSLRYYQTINLPAGDYVFKVAGRHSASSTLELNVTKGSESLGSVSDFPTGDTGRGISTDGRANFSDAGTYANGGAGRGWQWRYVAFTITEENADVTISIDGSAATKSQWLGFCNYTVQSAPSVAASTIAYNQAKETAEAARDNATYANVQGTDRSELVAAINADKGSTISSIDAAAENIRTKMATFTAGVASWNSLVSARTNASGVLPYASAAKKATLDAAVAAEVTGDAAAALVQVGVIEQANRLYIESNGLAEGVDGAENVTNLITNPNADTDASGWEGGFGRLTSEQLTQGDGTLGGGYFDKNGASSYSATQTISNLAPGKYLLTVTARAQSGTTTYKVKATNSRNEDFTADIPAVGNQGGAFGRGYNDASVVLEQNFTGNATIGIAASHSSNFWLSFDRVRLVRIADSDVTLANATDYTNLNNAINAVKDNVIGFDEGDYAPYNNAEAIALLAAAQAIDPEVENAQSTVQTATANLTGATWTVNTEELNAVYNGTFAATENNAAPAGWTSTKSGAFSGQYMPRVFNNDDRLSEFNGTKSAFFIRFDGTNSDRGTLYYYGNTENYTMPLKAGVTYYVKADVKGWGSTGKNQRINVNGPEGFTSQSQTFSLTNQAENDDNDPQQFLIIFTANVAGNYTISFQTPGDDNQKHNAVVSNIELKRATSASMAISNALYSTFVAPFDVTIPSGVTAYTVDYLDGNTLEMTEVTTTIPANTPVVLQSEDAVEARAFYGYPVAGTPTTGLLTGVYTTTAAPNGTYILQNQSGKVGFYQVNTDEAQPKVPANRAYLTAPDAGVKAFYFDDATAISSVMDGIAAGSIYDLNGRKVAKMQKGGIYVVNGKKVIIK